MAKMTSKQQRFCDEYLIDLNATQAAIRAGYSKKTAGVIAAENLKKPYIAEYIEKRMAEKEEALKKAKERYQSSGSKSGSMMAKANMVKDYNEKNGKGKE